MTLVASAILVVVVVFDGSVWAQSQEGPTSPLPAANELTWPGAPRFSTDAALQRAYTDVFNVLREPNACSDFYGGPTIATTVLKEYFASLSKERLPEYVAFLMRGKSINVYDLTGHVAFRLFETTVVNTEGAFYQGRTTSHEHRVPNIGPFLPGTRRARTLGLLHELGHLIRAADGQWLLPDDGNDPDKSRRNTRTIQKICEPALRRVN